MADSAADCAADWEVEARAAGSAAADLWAADSAVAMAATVVSVAAAGLAGWAPNPGWAASAAAVAVAMGWAMAAAAEAAVKEGAEVVGLGAEGSAEAAAPAAGTAARSAAAPSPSSQSGTAPGS